MSCHRLSVSLLAVLLTAQCAEQRPLRPVLGSSYRLPKQELLDGEYLFLKTISDVVHAGPNHRFLARGKYLVSDQIIKFDLHQSSATEYAYLDVLAQEPKFDESSGEEKSPLLARFRVRPVDILRKQTLDGQDTNEEEVTDSRNPPGSRKYIEIDTGSDRISTFESGVIDSIPTGELAWEPDQGAVNFDVQQTLDDQSIVRIRYSFLRYTKTSQYTPRPYSIFEQRRFGFFKTTKFGVDAYARHSRSERQEYLNRWSSSKPIVFHVLGEFPSSTLSQIKQAFVAYNQIFAQTVGRELLVLDQTEGEYRLGDLRANFLVYDESSYGEHGILGYAPCYADPRTGEILQANIVFYANAFRRAMLSGQILSQPLTPPTALMTKIDTEATDTKLDNQDPLLWPYTIADLVATTPQPTAVPSWFGRLALETDLPKAVKQIHKDLLSPQASHSTSFDGTMFLGIASRASAMRLELSSRQVEESLFNSLVLHELGHALGLRHNYLGSADKANFGDGGSSSVMDYLFGPTEQLQTLGSYDKAALTFAYTDKQERRTELLQTPFLYCTDEQLFDSKQALCQQFDSGSTLTDFIDNQLERYRASFSVNNLRNDEAFFGDNNKGYHDKVRKLLLPIRLAFDNAYAIIAAHHIPNRTKSHATLWRLLGSRIEADSMSSASITVELNPLPIGADAWPYAGLSRSSSLVQIDLGKLDAALNDANSAQRAALGALRSIVLDVHRSEAPIPHAFLEQTEVRGILADKVIALQLISGRTPSPLDDSTEITMFDSSAVLPELRELLCQLLSNTRLEFDRAKKPLYLPAGITMGLRRLALELITDQSSTQTTKHSMITSSTKSLLTSEITEIRQARAIAGLINLIVPADWHQQQTAQNQGREHPLSLTSELVREVESGRKKMRALYTELFESQLDRTNTRANLARIQRELGAAEEQRNAINLAFTQVSSRQFLSAPVRLDAQGVETATGHLIRDNINRLEDRLAAIDGLLTKKRTTPIHNIGEPSTQILDYGSISQLEELQGQLTKMLEQEVLMLDLMYQAAIPRRL